MKKDSTREIKDKVMTDTVKISSETQGFSTRAPSDSISISAEKKNLS